MEKFFKFFIGFICAVTTIVWLRIMIAPVGFAEGIAVIPEVPFGLNNIRSMAGGFVGGIAIFSFLTLKTGDKQWLLGLLCFLAAALIGRTCGLIMDGFHQKIVGGMVVEIVLITLTFAAYRKLPDK